MIFVPSLSSEPLCFVCSAAVVVEADGGERVVLEFNRRCDLSTESGGAFCRSTRTQRAHVYDDLLARPDIKC